MHLAVRIIATVALLLSAASARAATPIAPTSGSSFTTSDSVTFEAQAGPEESDSDYLFVFSAQPDFTANEWLALGGEDHELDVHLGWLAGKLDRIGDYWWAVCPTGPDFDVLTDQCSASATFSLRFRLPDLTRVQARIDARHVMSHKFRSYWRSGYSRTVSCTRVTRTR